MGSSLNKRDTMKYLLLLFFIFINGKLLSQHNSELLNNSLQLDIARSKHGTGDSPGFIMNAEYKKYFRQRLSFSIGLGATINDGSVPIFYTDQNGNNIDASIRYNTDGLQLSSKLGISFIKNTDNDFGFQIGPLLRYQSSSYYDELNVLFPLLTGLPFPVTATINNSPQKTYSLGGLAQLYYNHAINDKVYIGVSIGLQTDTNGDTIKQAGLACGMKF